MARLVVFTKGVAAPLLELSGGWVTIGRADGNTLQVVAASVSERYCEVRPRGGSSRAERRARRQQPVGWLGQGSLARFVLQQIGSLTQGTTNWLEVTNTPVLTGEADLVTFVMTKNLTNQFIRARQR